ncbi:enoyl-CoA hydratase-related protein [Streptomyces sp. NPDC017979]|uniref:enoyl-CoA hydratase-related protein n=1 Tax=Streptomyces sp. NPDC017979 TaxID=3365024 RepID=UPI0037888996
MTDTVLYSVDDAVATIAMNRPERRNAFTVEMADGLMTAFEHAEGDSKVRAVVLTGTGNNFCVGRDNSEAPEPPYPPGDYLQGRTKLMRISRLVTFMYEMTTPVIAEIRGGCAGAGMSFALGCDFRYASTDAVMSTAFIKVAFAGDLGASWLLTRAVGPLRARELMMLSPKVRGTELADWGLVNAVVPPDELAARTRDTAARIAAAAPGAMAALRHNLQAAQTLSLGDYLPVEADHLMTCAVSPDAEEARRAFLEKRAPRYGAYS